MTALLEFVHSDCSIRVSRSLVTISYYVVLILCVTVLLEYLDLYHKKCAKLSFLSAHFSNFPPNFPAFCFYQRILPKIFPAKSAHPYTHIHTHTLQLLLVASNARLLNGVTVCANAFNYNLHKEAMLQYYNVMTS